MKFWHLICVFMVLILSGCVNPKAENEIKKWKEFPRELLIEQDLPAGWKWKNDQLEEKPDNVVTLSRSFGNKSNEGTSNIMQELTVFPDADSAQKAYPLLMAKTFPTRDWKPYEDIQFVPVDPTDQYTVQCVKMTARGRSVLSCTALQQHGRYLSKIFTLTDGNVLTNEQVTQMLTSFDQRLSQAK